MKKSQSKSVWARAKQIVTSRKGKITILALTIALFGVLMAISASVFRYNIGADAISYISIAHQYADGHFSSAINAFWSPLISWLITPFVGGMSGMWAIMMMNIVVALFTLGFGAAMVWRWTKGSFAAALVYVVALGPFFVEVVRVKTPDVLVVAWMVIFVAAAVHALKMVAEGKKLWKIALLLGAVGALGYVTKLYLLPVFVVGLGIWGLMACFARPNTVKQPLAFLKRHVATWLFIPLASIGFMLLIASPWITALSVKYGKVTLGSSYEVNISSQFDKKLTGEAGTTEDEKLEELRRPPNEHAVHHSADPTQHVIDRPERPEGERPSLKDRVSVYVGERMKGLPFYVNRISSINPFALLILVMVGFALLMSALRLKKHAPALVAWAFGVVYFMGYAMTANPDTAGGNTRYYWPVFIMAMLSFCLLLPALWQQVEKSKQWIRKAVFVLLVVVITLMPAIQFIGGIRYVSMIPVQRDLTVVKGERSQMIEVLLQGFKAPEKPHHLLLAEAIEADGILPKGSKVVGDNYIVTLYLAHLLQLQLYGDRDAGYDRLENPEEKLKEYGVEYLITYTPEGEKPTSSIDGEVVGAYHYVTPCDDDSRVGMIYVPCDIRVVKIND